MSSFVSAFRRAIAVLPAIFGTLAFPAGWFDSFSSRAQEFRSLAESYSSGGNAVGVTVEEARDSVAKAMDEISPEEEYYIGRAFAAKILAMYPVCDNPDAQKYMNMILHSLAVFSERPVLFKDYSIVILDSDEVNAFASSGGHILVTKGLAACAQSEDALAAVIAHEVAHILLKHSVGAIKSSRLASSAMKAGADAYVAAGGDAGVAGDVSGRIDEAITEIIRTGYSQTQELSADAKALELLNDAGYDPHSMDSMLRALESRSSPSDSAGFGRTHPSPSVRLKNVGLRYRFYPPSSSFKKSPSRDVRFAAFRKSLFGE